MHRASVQSSNRARVLVGLPFSTLRLMSFTCNNYVRHTLHAMHQPRDFASDSIPQYPIICKQCTHHQPVGFALLTICLLTQGILHLCTLVYIYIWLLTTKVL